VTSIFPIYFTYLYLLGSVILIKNSGKSFTTTTPAYYQNGWT